MGLGENSHCGVKVPKCQCNLEFHYDYDKESNTCVWGEPDYQETNEFTEFHETENEDSTQFTQLQRMSGNRPLSTVEVCLLVGGILAVIVMVAVGVGFLLRRRSARQNCRKVGKVCTSASYTFIIPKFTHFHIHKSVDSRLHYCRYTKAPNSERTGS
jgi:hypothetical protein